MKAIGETAGLIDVAGLNFTRVIPYTAREHRDAGLPGPRPSGAPLARYDGMRCSLRSNNGEGRGFAAFGGLLGGIGLGLPRGRYRLGRLRAQLLRHRCQAHRAASMRELQPDPCLHHPVVSPQRMKPAGCLDAAFGMRSKGRAEYLMGPARSAAATQQSGVRPRARHAGGMLQSPEYARPNPLVADRKLPRIIGIRQPPCSLLQIDFDLSHVEQASPIGRRPRPQLCWRVPPLAHICFRLGRD
jgi:hypothetical protein